MIVERFNIEESSCVSDIVTKLSRDLGKEIIFSSKNNKKVMHKYRNMMLSKGVFNFDTQDKLSIPFIKVKYNIYYFNNKEHYDIYKEYDYTLDADSGSTDYKNRTITLNLLFIKGKPSENFYSTIQHEMNHFFQNDNGATKDENFYERVADLRKNGTNEEQWIAYALYLSFNTEIDSFASQYYAYLTQNKINPMSSKDYNSTEDTNNPYYEFNKTFDRVDSMDIDEENLKKKFGITLNHLYSILNNADKRLLTKIHKVWNKYVSEQIAEGKPFNTKRMSFLYECYDKGVHDFDDDL